MAYTTASKSVARKSVRVRISRNVQGGKMLLYIVQRGVEDWDDCPYDDSIWIDPADALYRLAEVAFQGGKPFDDYWDIKVFVANKAPTSIDLNFAYMSYAPDWDFSKAPEVEIEQMNLYNAINFNLRNIVGKKLHKAGKEMELYKLV